MSRKKVLYFVAVDWFFYSHFLERAIAAQLDGYEVVLVTQIYQHREFIESTGVRVIPLKINRRSINPFISFRTLCYLIKLFQNERPDILHQVALKPILLGSLAARFARINHVINAVVGGGYLFTAQTYQAKLLLPLIQFALRWLLNPQGSRVIFENRDDMSAFVSAGYVRCNDAVLIRGAGVDVSLYHQKTRNSSCPLVILPARLLWDKGVGDFVDAARLLHKQGVKARFALVGDVDPDNRASIPSEILNLWREEGDVELWGFRSDIVKVLSEADIVCLPSYREGLPKALLDGMASGLPCVTTDVPGCREAVQDGRNGLLVPPRDPESLAFALAKLIHDPELRGIMGSEGKTMALSEFSSEIVCRETLRVYAEVLAS